MPVLPAPLFLDIKDFFAAMAYKLLLALRLTEGEHDLVSSCEKSRRIPKRFLEILELFLATFAEESFRTVEGMTGLITNQRMAQKPPTTIKEKYRLRTHRMGTT